MGFLSASSLKRKKPWLIEGVDYLFDSVASPETLETGMRIVKARTKDLDTFKERSGAIIVTGVSSPKRFEWTPWYFKEIRIIGSNAFAIEEYEQAKVAQKRGAGQRKVVVIGLDLSLIHI